MSSTDNIARAIEQVTVSIRSLEQRFHRTNGSVQLLAVSKTKPVADIRSAIAAGQYHFGENYLDEALDKIEALKDEPCHWHFIGGIQSRKTQQIAEHFDWVHSVDRVKLINRLATRRPTTLPPLNICLQVNLDDEPGKSGATESQLPELSDAVAQHDTLRLRGLMAIPAPRETLEEQRQPFARLSKLMTTLQQTHPGLDTLSMGMSGDMAAAIAEGATIVRVGTAIFGKRD